MEKRALVFNFVNKNIENYRHILYYPSTQKYGGSCLIRLYKSIKRTAEYILLLLVKLKTARVRMQNRNRKKKKI